MIIRHNSQANQPVTFSDPRSPVAEAFRSLRTNIQFASVDRPLKTLLVTSPSPAEGKSTIAANLSVVMAQNDRKVVLIDADLRKPKIHILMNLSNRTGISNLFVQNPVQLDGTLQSGQVTGLSVLPAGDTPPNPAELLGSGKMKDILIAVEQQCDIVILDSPPVMAVADSAILAPQVDGVLLVLKPNVTIRQSAVQSVDQLRRSGANLIGVVLNEVDIKRNRYNYYRYRGYLYGSKQYFNQPNPGWRKYLPWLNKPKKQS
jgi:non-specific protein-tyrosine kinase